MSARAVLSIAVLVVAGTVASVTAARAGQDPAAPPGTITLGPLRISPSVVLTDMGVDANVFNEPVDPKRDFTFTLTPRASVQFRMRRLRLGYDTSTDYVYFRKYRTERGINASSSARLTVDLGRLTPYLSVTGLSSRARINREVDARARHRDLVYGAGAAFKVASRTSVVLNGTQGRVTYDPDAEKFRGVSLEDAFNGRRRAADAGLSVELTPVTTFSMTLGREQQRFALSPDRDSNSWRVTPTFSFSPTGVLRGTASVGYRRFEPESPAVPGYSGLVSAVTIGATIYGRHEVQAAFSRDVQYSYDLASTYYLGTGGTLTWTWLLAGPLDIRGTAGRFLMDYSDQGHAPDRSINYGGGMGYRFKNQARLGINFDWWRRDSDAATERTFRNHRIFAGLSWGRTL